MHLKGTEPPPPKLLSCQVTFYLDSCHHLLPKVIRCEFCSDGYSRTFDSPATLCFRQSRGNACLFHIFSSKPICCSRFCYYLPLFNFILFSFKTVLLSLYNQTIWASENQLFIKHITSVHIMITWLPGSALKVSVEWWCGGVGWWWVPLNDVVTPTSF